MRRGAIFGVCAAVIFLGGAEIAARVLGFGHALLYQASASGYELVPSQNVNRLGKSTHINSIGGRGPEIELPLASGTTRILSIGDSVANGGVLVNDEQTYPMMVGECLRSSGAKVEMLNVAAGGWAVQNEAAWLASHGLHGARIVLLEVNEGDLGEAFVDGSLLDEHPSFPSHQPFSGLTEILFRYALPRVGIGKASDPGSTVEMFKAENTESMMAAIRQIKDLSDKGGARMVIMYWDPRASSGEAADNARNQLFKWADKAGVRVIRPQLNRAANAGTLFRDGIHPNEKGNAALATAICKSKLI